MLPKTQKEAIQKKRKKKMKPSSESKRQGRGGPTNVVMSIPELKLDDSSRNQRPKRKGKFKRGTGGKRVQMTKGGQESFSGLFNLCSGQRQPRVPSRRTGQKEAQEKEGPSKKKGRAGQPHLQGKSDKPKRERGIEIRNAVKTLWMGKKKVHTRKKEKEGQQQAIHNFRSQNLLWLTIETTDMIHQKTRHR